MISDLPFPPNAVGRDLLDPLRAGLRKEALFYPTLAETITESVHLDRARRERIEHLCAELSQGYFFRFRWDVIAREALAKVRPGVDTSLFLIPPRITKSSDAENLACSQAIWKDNGAFENAVNPLTSEELKSLVSLYPLDGLPHSSQK